MEPLENIGMRCEHHKSHPNPEFFDKPFEFFIGKYCKLAFPAQDGRHELMWVKVEKAEEIEGTMMLVGFLDNDPVLATNFNCGDGIGFERNEVHDVLASR